MKVSFGEQVTEKQNREAKRKETGTGKGSNSWFQQTGTACLLCRITVLLRRVVLVSNSVCSWKGGGGREMGIDRMEKWEGEGRKTRLAAPHHLQI
jgi:hypothetical protein